MSSIHSSPASSRSVQSISSSSTSSSSSYSGSSPERSPSRSPRSPSPVRVASTSNLEVRVQLGRRTPGTTVQMNKENLETLVLKVVPVFTNTRTLKRARYWVAVAVGDRSGLIGVGEHVGGTEAVDTKKAEKKAIKSIKRIQLLDERTIEGRVTGFSGGDCLSLSQAPRGVGIISTSGLARKLLPLAGIKDCFVTNCYDKLTSVRAIAKAFSKLSRSSR